MQEAEDRPLLYIDIDGVLLANDQQLADGAVEFIKYIAGNFEVYWLTTHCMHGDAYRAVLRVNELSDEVLSPWLNKFKPNTWRTNKTEAIDFSKEFIWYDDDLFPGEREELLKNDAYNSWHEVDLRNYPDQLLRELKILREYIDGSMSN